MGAVGGIIPAWMLRSLQPLLGWLVAIALLCSSGSEARQAAPTRVLFIGNSLTAANDLPGLVAALAQTAGDRLECQSVTFGGYSLEDHWNQGDARRAIAQGGWSVVVLQQGPSALPESQRLLREYAARFARDIERIGARTALYMVWPSASRRFDFDGVSRSYANAAKAVGGILMPAGEAWRAAWRRDSKIALYSADGLHPTPAGSYLAALVIHQRLTTRSPVGLATTLTSPTGAWPPVVIAPALAAMLQEAAREATDAVAR
jgi:hypothetical protein